MINLTPEDRGAWVTDIILTPEDKQIKINPVRSNDRARRGTSRCGAYSCQVWFPEAKWSCYRISRFHRNVCSVTRPLDLVRWGGGVLCILPNTVGDDP